jgi:hypothetical protein
MFRVQEEAKQEFIMKLPQTEPLLAEAGEGNWKP